MVVNNVERLEPYYSTQKSFHGKAIVQSVPEENAKILFSYNVPVVTVYTNPSQVIFEPEWRTSPTTIRHVVEFLKQNGYNVSGKDDVARLAAEQG